MPRRGSLFTSACATVAALFAVTGCSELLGTSEPRLVPADGGTDAAAEVDSGVVTCADATQTLCEGGCVEPLTDPQNCGSCRHDCLGGVCADGECQTVVVATGLNAVHDVIVDGDVFFLASASGRSYLLERARVRSGFVCEGADARCILEVPAMFAPSPELSPPVPTLVVARPRDLLLLYPDYGIVRRDREGTATDVFASLAGITAGHLVSVGAGAAYGVPTVAAAYYVAPGGTPRPVLRLTSSESVTDLLSIEEGSRLAVEIVRPLGSGIQGVALLDLRTEGAPCEDATCLLVPGRIRGIAAAGTWIYVARQLGEVGAIEIVRLHPDGGCDGRLPCPEVVVASTSVHLQDGLMADDRHVYWTDFGSARSSIVVRLPTDEVCLKSPCGSTFMGPLPGAIRLRQDRASVVAWYVDNEIRIVRKAK